MTRYTQQTTADERTPQRRRSTATVLLGALTMLALTTGGVAWALGGGAGARPGGAGRGGGLHGGGPAVHEYQRGRDLGRPRELGRGRQDFDHEGFDRRHEHDERRRLSFFPEFYYPDYYEPPYGPYYDPCDPDSPSYDLADCE